MKPGFRILGLLLLFFVISGNAYNQSGPIDYSQQLKMPTVLPASPDAAGIEKFGNIPVGYATGVPDISIPVYTIKCGGISWPVSLSYHAGGIRVDEIASSVGLGWSLNAPGVISRSRVGRHDEENYDEPTYNYSIGPGNYQYLYNVLNGFADSEQDIFNFNFNGRSGKFIVNQDSSILQIPLSNLKIAYTTGFNSFTIIDENGVTYLFDQKEMASSQSMPSELTASLYYSSWYLSKVEMPDKNNIIQFSYGTAGQSTQSFTTFTQAVGMKYFSPGEAPILDNSDVRSFSITSLITDVIKLSRISFPNGSIIFNYDASARSDALTYNKLSAIIINRVLSNDSIQIKKFNLHQSYFYNNPNGSAGNPYRLKLDSLSESGLAMDPSPKKYKFQYNSTPMVPRENYGQDIWGFNNGQSGNPSLLQSESITFQNGYASTNLTYQIGDANRSVDTSQMKACMLTSITYPTGGKTTFTFEPHVYSADQTLTSLSQYEANISGNQTPQVATTTFTYPSTAVATEVPRVIVNMSMYNFPNITQPSWVSIKDLTTGALFYVQAQPNPNQSFSWNQSIDNLVQGHNYELKAYVYTSTPNSQLTASIKVTWNNYTSAPDIRRGGGLRVKEIKNYTANGVLAGTETYLYDTAVTLTPFYHIQRTYSEVYYRLGIGDGGDCFYYMSPVCRVYHSGSVYAMSTAAGAPLAYKRVQKITTDSVTGAVNGKSEYQYDVFRDENYPAGGTYMMIPLISNDWRNGFLKSETHYKINNGVYSPVKKTENYYNEFYPTQSYSLRVQPNYIREGCSIHQDSLSIFNDGNWYLYPIRSGSKRLWEQKETVYDDNQNRLETYTYNYYMSNKYDFPTKTISIDSKNTQDSVVYKRPTDFSSPGNVYEKMEQRNMIAPVIEQKSYSNAALLNTIKSNYRDWYGDGKIISPDSIQASVLNNPLETRLKYYGYDTYNNPLSVSKTRDAVSSYIWAYNKTYPIAEAVNADNNSIAYTSFETNEAGGWSGITIPGFATNGSITGQRAFTQNNFSFSKPGLSIPGTYTVSYWSKNGSYAVNSTAATTLKTANGWTLYEHKVINPSGGNITVSGSGTIDELRLYPSSAQMKTYTYDPLAGITSQCDVNNNIVYYSYDNLSRLFLVRDDNKNIIKKICYNYSGQPDNCSVYGNTVKSGTYSKNCSAGLTGTQVTYTVPANTFYATTQADADTLAKNEIYANGQNYADQNGTCAVTINCHNYSGTPFTISFTNTSTSQMYSTYLDPSAGSTLLVPPGSYNVSFSQSGSVSNYFYVNGYSSIGVTANFYGVSMTSTSLATIGY